jgi:hypothetical protein
MKANELRIGNWISDRGMKEWQIDSWERKNKVAAKSPIFKFGDLDMEGHPLTEEVDFLIPIPLTEEWHNKFGVKIDGFKSFQYTISKRKSIIFTGDYVYLRDWAREVGKTSLDDNLCTLWNKDLKRRDMFVHEWQNLYFALTGEELTLT